jgi:hypothetical protein
MVAEWCAVGAMWVKGTMLASSGVAGRCGVGGAGVDGAALSGGVGGAWCWRSSGVVAE